MTTSGTPPADPLGSDPIAETVGPASPRMGSPALPVAVDLPEPTAGAVRRFVDGVLGWQTIDRSTAALVPPTVRFVGANSPRTDDHAPRVLLLPPDLPAADAVRAAIGSGADAALIWPDERDHLASVVTGILDRPDRSSKTTSSVLRIGGTAGGVGTTTVALAAAGLAGWSGVRCLVTLRGDAPAADLPVITPSAVAASDLWDRLPRLPATRDLRAVRIAGPPPEGQPTDRRIDLAIFDQGGDVEVDVVVCRPDGAALEGLPSTTAAVVIIVGDGPVPHRDLVRLIEGRRSIHLPWSARVARAGAQRRIPGSLPGSWLRLLSPLMITDAGPTPPRRPQPR